MTISQSTNQPSKQGVIRYFFLRAGVVQMSTAFVSASWLPRHRMRISYAALHVNTHID